MNIEQAITTLELLRELMLFDSTSGEDITVESLSKNNKDLYNAAQVAIDALREKREKGCEYCAGYHSADMLPIIEMDDNTANSLDINEGFAYINCQCGRHTVAEINFCPMCGRNLTT